MNNLKKEIIRSQTHAGSWYSESVDLLNTQLTNWLGKVKSSENGPARAIIVPHAGYQHSGECAAYAYKEVDSNLIKRVFIFGPSHFHYLNGCSLSGTDKYETPFYNLKIDKEINDELFKTKLFSKMDLSVDEEEHSIEMHLPYIAKIMDKKEFTIIPVLVGSLSSSDQINYGKLFSKYLIDQNNLFVISSDFCHWGKRFKYQFYDRDCGEIYQSIENLDKIGMKSIETCSLSLFNKYLKEYNNTICGRNPIMILLSVLVYLEEQENYKDKFCLKFLNYAQSNKCKTMSDSSVSYAAASLTVKS